MDPLESAQLVIQAIVAGVARLLGQLGQAHIAEQAEAVVDGDANDPLAGPGRLVKSLFPAGAAHICAAVDVDDDRRFLGVVGGPDVQVLAVLAVSVIQPLAELDVIEGIAAVFILRGKGVVLHGAGAELAGIIDAVPVGHLLGVLPAAGLCIADALIGGHARGFGCNAPDIPTRSAAQMVKEGQAGGSTADRGQAGKCADGCGSAHTVQKLPAGNHVFHKDSSF